MSIPGAEVARPTLFERGLLALAEPILIAGRRAVDHSTEVFIGIGVAKSRNAVSIADGERGGEVRYLGEVDASEGKLPVSYAACAVGFFQCQGRSSTTRVIG